MIVSSSSLFRGLLLAAAVSAAGAGFAHDASHARMPHNFGPVSAESGQPGVEGVPSRRVEIVATEADGAMHFTPERLNVEAGEQIEFVVRNAGLLAHEFVVGTSAANVAHAHAMFADPAMAHDDDPNAVRVAPGGAARLLWKFTEAGQFEFACLIPGHYEAGMKGQAAVR